MKNNNYTNPSYEISKNMWLFLTHIWMYLKNMYFYVRTYFTYIQFFKLA